MIAHLSFSGRYYGRESAAFSLVKALQCRIDVIMLLVIENRSGLRGNTHLVKKLKGFGIHNEIIYTDNKFSTATCKKLYALIDQYNITLIHCHCFKSVIYSLFIRLRHNKSFKIVFTLHGLILPFTIKSVIFKIINLLCVALSDGVIGCTNKYLPAITSLPLLKKKTIVIVNAYEQESKKHYTTEEARQALESYCGKLSRKLVVAFIGRFIEVKNPLLFLDVVARIKEMYSGATLPVHFVMIGDGELNLDIEAYLSSHDLKTNVTLTGYISDMSKIYPAIDILLMTSDIEGIPMCILESMSYSIPVIAPNVGGIPEIIRDGETGFLFSRRNAQECTNHLSRLINSNNLKMTLGENGNRYLKSKFSFTNSIKSHLDFYKTLLPESAKLASDC
jgi:glycosyltransferase involved in cell wall biosynthesis